MFSILKETPDDTRIIKAWIGTQDKPIYIESSAKAQLFQASKLPFIFKWISAMPDMHTGNGSTIGSVIPTRNALIPAAVGLDVGCGVSGVLLDCKIEHIDKIIDVIYNDIKRKIPNGRTDNGGHSDAGRWSVVPDHIQQIWKEIFSEKYAKVSYMHPQINPRKDCVSVEHLGTLGTGNHFIELCTDECNRVWILVHSGSRGLGARIAKFFMRKAKEECQNWYVDLPNQDLAFFPKSSPLFESYLESIKWLQQFAYYNRGIMQRMVIDIIKNITTKCIEPILEIDCHHNFAQYENHFGQNIIVTRKGAVQATKGKWLIIPGSMGTKSYICEGLGNPDSFNSCSHGAGRRYSRTDAQKLFTVEDHLKATEGVVCIKDSSVLDETPGSYKNIDDVMEAQKDLVKIHFTLKQLLCVKGASESDGDHVVAE